MTFSMLLWWSLDKSFPSPPKNHASIVRFGFSRHGHHIFLIVHFLVEKVRLVCTPIFRWSREISEIEWGRRFSYIISVLAITSYIQNMKKVLVYWWTVKSWVNGPMTSVRPTGWIIYTRAIMILSDCTMDRPQNKPQNCIYFLKSKAPKSAAENELELSKLVLKLDVSKLVYFEVSKLLYFEVGKSKGFGVVNL